MKLYQTAIAVEEGEPHVPTPKKSWDPPRVILPSNGIHIDCQKFHHSYEVATPTFGVDAIGPS